MNIDNKVYLGVVVSPHGLKGDVWVKTFTQTPQDLFSYGTLYDEKGNKLNIISRSIGSSGKLVVHFFECNDRNNAQLLVGKKIYIDRSQLPKLEQDEYYYDDLVGCKIFDHLDQGMPIGTVLSVNDYGGGIFLDISLSSTTKIATLPFHKESVLHVNLDQKSLLINSSFLIAP